MWTSTPRCSASALMRSICWRAPSTRTTQQRRSPGSRCSAWSNTADTTCAAVSVTGPHHHFDNVQSAPRRLQRPTTRSEPTRPTVTSVLTSAAMGPTGFQRPSVTPRTAMFKSAPQVTAAAPRDEVFMTRNRTRSRRSVSDLWTTLTAAATAVDRDGAPARRSRATPCAPPRTTSTAVRSGCRRPCAQW